MKVCWVGNLPEPYGGVASYCYNLSLALSEFGVDVYFFDTIPAKNKDIPASLEDYYVIQDSLFSKIKKIFKYIVMTRFDIDFFKLILILVKEFLHLPWVLWKRMPWTFLLSFELYYFIKHQAYIDIIHSQHANFRSLSALIVGKTLNIPVVMTVFTSEFTMSKNRFVLPVAVRTSKEVDKIVCISNYARRLVLENCVSVAPLVIYCGVNSNDFHPNHNVASIIQKYRLRDEKIILYVGWFIERKGPLILLEALRYIKQENIKAFFIGPDHGLKKQMEDFIIQNGLTDRVILLGQVTDEELRSFYALSDVFVFPTITQDEGFGIVAVEAMASGTPVIGSRIAAIPEVVADGITGLLFEPGDYEDLLTKLKILLNNDELRNNLSQRARREILARFSWTLAAKRTLDVYDGLY